MWNRGAEPGEPAAARLYPEKQNAQSSVLWSWQDNSEGGGGIKIKISKEKEREPVEGKV